MPVTARLSRRFYEAFGDEIANELVDWFNAVDLTYRGDLIKWSFAFWVGTVVTILLARLV